ncbi:MAG: hypothetical protein ACR2GU_09155 [Rubrobacteraceae bacterium]
MELVLLANAAATLVMVGVIWFVQIVHYPLFGSVGAEFFTAYSEAHSRLTTYVVGPPMLLEAATTGLLILARPGPVPIYLPLAGAILLTVVWISTAFLQVPGHRTLGLGFDLRAHHFLVASNWVRTAAWSARGILVLWMLALTVR